METASITSIIGQTKRSHFGCLKAFCSKNKKMQHVHIEISDTRRGKKTVGGHCPRYIHRHSSASQRGRHRQRESETGKTGHRRKDRNMEEIRRERQLGKLLEQG